MFFRVLASLSSKCKGRYTSVVTFQTLACAPEPPAPPELAAPKKKNELTLRWSNNNSGSDNGHKTTNFVLECQPITASLENNTTSADTDSNTDPSSSPTVFSRVYHGPLRRFTVKKLAPATCYAFRLAAENALGLSEFSKPTLIYTARSVPSAPTPPRLVRAFSTRLQLAWSNNSSSSSDVTNYELQHCDTNGFFLTVYNGPLCEHDCGPLARCTAHLFRVRAHNEEGASVWSDTSSVATTSEMPAAPISLRVTKTTTEHKWRVSWEPPRDDGGAPITVYSLQMKLSSDDADTFKLVYEGESRECYLDASVLEPGALYWVRVACSNATGCSDYSECVSFTSACTKPAKCEPAKMVGKPRATQAQVKWSSPRETGGCVISGYEVRLAANKGKFFFFFLTILFSLY